MTVSGILKYKPTNIYLKTVNAQESAKEPILTIPLKKINGKL